MSDSLGNYLKSLEQENEKIADNNNCIYLRLDGRHFSTLTKSFLKPYDGDFMYSMHLISSSLFNEFLPNILMQQSDEISLVWLPIEFPQERIFGGKYNKLLSLVPAYASALLSNRYDRVITFDARMYEGDFDVMAKSLWWRYKDCKRNSISMIASAFRSEKQLNGVSTEDRLKIIQDEKIWQRAPDSFKYGFWITKNPEKKYPVCKSFNYYSEFYDWLKEI